MDTACAVVDGCQLGVLNYPRSRDQIEIVDSTGIQLTFDFSFPYLLAQTGATKPDTQSRSRSSMSPNVLPTTNPLPPAPAEKSRPASPTPPTTGTQSPTLPKNGPRQNLFARLALDLDVDNKRADWISIYACLLTGFTAAISFSVSSRYMTSGYNIDTIRLVSFGADSRRESLPLPCVPRRDLIV
jgi:hypothetical protein